jgi:hypothetical protein
MRLAGSANWWAPAPLRRLYDRFGLHEHVDLTDGTDRDRGVVRLRDDDTRDGEPRAGGSLVGAGTSGGDPGHDGGR